MSNNEEIRGHIFKYITDVSAPLRASDARFPVRSNEELKINELMFDAPLFFPFLRETKQIENNVTDEECVTIVANSIAQYFRQKLLRIKRYGSFKKVIFINLIHLHRTCNMFFSYLVSGVGKFSDFRTLIDKQTNEDIYTKLEDGFFKNNVEDIKFSKLQKLFNDFNENDPIDSFYELAFLIFFIDSYCSYLFQYMDTVTIPGTLTVEEAKRFETKLKQVFNMYYDKAFHYFEIEYYHQCLEELKKINIK